MVASRQDGAPSQTSVLSPKMSKQLSDMFHVGTQCATCHPFSTLHKRVRVRTQTEGRRARRSRQARRTRAKTRTRTDACRQTPPRPISFSSLPHPQPAGRSRNRLRGGLGEHRRVAGRLERHIDALESRQHRCSLGRWPPHSVTCARTGGYRRLRFHRTCTSGPRFQGGSGKGGRRAGGARRQRHRQKHGEERSGREREGKKESTTCEGASKRRADGTIGQADTAVYQ